jgi:hypothetical protein
MNAVSLQMKKGARGGSLLLVARCGLFVANDNF